MDEKISILLEVVAQQQARLERAAAGIDKVSAANERAQRTVSAANRSVDTQAKVQERANRAFMEVTAAIRARQRMEQQQARTIDATTRATERATKAAQKQAQVIQRQQGPNLAGDPNKFFRNELAKQEQAEAATRAARDRANANRAAELARQRAVQVQSEQRSATQAALVNARIAATEQLVAQRAAQTQAALAKKQAAQERATRAVRDASQINTTATNVLGKFHQGLIAAQAAALALTAAILPMALAINRAEDIGRLSEKVGITVQALSELQFAAQIDKLTFEQFNVGLKGFSKAITDASTAGTNAQRGFAALGIQTRDVNGATRDTLTLLLEVADAFSKYRDDAAKATVAQFLFEESGINFIPLLNRGSAGLAEMADKAREYGASITDAQAKQSRDFNQSLREMRAISGGVALQFTQEILPTLIEFARVLIENRKIVIAVIATLTALVGALSTAALGMKAFAIITATGAAAFSAYLAAFVGAAAIIMGVVEAIKEYNARVEEQVTINNLATQQAGFRDKLKEEIKLLRESGKLSAERADQAQRALDKSAATGDLVMQQRALQIVRDTVREAEGLDRIQKVQAQAAGAGAQSNLVAQASGLSPSKPVPDELKPGLVVPTSSQLRDINRVREISDEIDQQILESRAQRLDSEALRRLAAQNQEIIDNQRRLDEIEKLESASQSEKNLLLENNERLHQERMLAIEQESQERSMQAEKRRQEELARLRQIQLQGTSDMFGNIAQAIKEFGAEGTTAYKVFATAQAVISTAVAAIQAYSSVVGVPYVGPILAPIAAGAAIAVGAAQIAKINGAFAEGGIVPGAPSAVDNRIAAVATGELIISAASTRSLISQGGMGAVGALLAGELPFGDRFTGGYIPRSSASAFAAGGIVGPIDGSSGAGLGSVDVTLLDARNRQDVREAQARDAAVMVIDNLNRRGNRLRA